jgi:hypothetical protein
LFIALGIFAAIIDSGIVVVIIFLIVVQQKITQEVDKYPAGTLRRINFIQDAKLGIRLALQHFSRSASETTKYQKMDHG